MLCILLPPSTTHPSLTLAGPLVVVVATRCRSARVVCAEPLTIRLCFACAAREPTYALAELQENDCRLTNLQPP